MVDGCETPPYVYFSFMNQLQVQVLDEDPNYQINQLAGTVPV